MLPFKLNIDVSKIGSPQPVPTPKIPDVSPTATRRESYAEHSKHYRGYAYNPNMKPVAFDLSRYPRLASAIAEKKGLFISEWAEIDFIELIVPYIPYTKLGTVDDRFAFAEWSELMTNPYSTFEVLE